MMVLNDQHMRLAELLDGFCDVEVNDAIFVSGLCLDSRTAQPGECFVALDGEHHHGIDFAEQALEKGCNAVVYTSPQGDDAAQVQHKVEALRTRGVALFAVDKLRAKLGEIAARFYQNPANDMTVIGVTGTNGKTSCAMFIAAALSHVAKKHNQQACGVIGTIGNGLYGQLQTATHTTPDAIQLQRQFAEFRQQSVSHVAMEVSSHALQQQRTTGVPFHTAIFTNLTHEHLDYHGDVTSYAAAKQQLFHSNGLRYAVINVDDETGRAFIRQLPDSVRFLAYSLDAQTALETDAVFQDNVMYLGCATASGLTLTSKGIEMELDSPWGCASLASRLLGRFNASNILAVVSTLLLQRLPMDVIVKAVKRMKPVAGRMQTFREKHQPLVVVDYAHTPDALEQVLVALKEHCRGKLYCVFGCGGDRDTSKRAMMGAVAEQYADAITLTNDNPRSEAPEDIIEQIIAGISDKQRVSIEKDRLTAITSAIHAASQKDVVLIAGKGHETCQIIGDNVLDFSDIDTVSACLHEASR